MKTISITNARNNIKTLVDRVKYRGETFAIGRRKKPEVMIIKYPINYRQLDEMTLFNVVSGSFDFLADEPELYNIHDCKVRFG